MPFFGMPLCLTGFFSTAVSDIINLRSRLRGCACFVRRRSAAHERENLKAYKILEAKILLRPLRGIDAMFLSEHERCAKCELRNMAQ